MYAAMSLPAAFGTRIIIRDHCNALEGGLPLWRRFHQNGPKGPCGVNAALQAGIIGGVKKACLVSVAALMLAACSRTNIENKDAVKAAMVEYLTSHSNETGLDPARMDINVSAVAFERDVARATVAFTVKGTDTGMQLNYTLGRQGNKWVVTGKDAAAGPHPIAGPPAGEAPGPVKEASPLPMPLPGTQGALPAGHPAVNPGPAK